MNEFLTGDWVERVDRLALGLEPLDAARAAPITHPIRVVFDEEARGLRRPMVRRHDSCRHVLLYEPGVAGRVKLRFLEEARRFVPRLISFPIAPPVVADSRAYPHRVRRPRLFPGAAYDLVAGITGLRGRVEHAGQPVRWARVVASLPGNGTVVGRAHGDDRGEFLLLISTAASSVGDLTDPLPVQIGIAAPASPPARPTDPLGRADRWWDLPEEIAPAFPPDDPELDPVSAGRSLPAGYTEPVTTALDLRLGRLISRTTAFIIP